MHLGTNISFLEPPLLAPVGPTIAPKNVSAARKIGKRTPSVEFQGLVASRIASSASFGLHFDGFGTDLRLTFVDARIIFGSVASGASLGLQFGRSGTDDRWILMDASIIGISALISDSISESPWALRTTSYSRWILGICLSIIAW